MIFIKTCNRINNLTFTVLESEIANVLFFSNRKSNYPTFYKSLIDFIVCIHIIKAIKDYLKFNYNVIFLCIILFYANKTNQVLLPCFAYSFCSARRLLASQGQSQASFLLFLPLPLPLPLRGRGKGKGRKSKKQARDTSNCAKTRFWTFGRSSFSFFKQIR